MVKAWYRVVRKTLLDGTPRTKRKDVLRSAGGRFHEGRDAEPTSYAGESLLTAWSEVTARLGRARPNPTVWKAWQLAIRGGRFIDLRKTATRRKWDIAEDTIYRDPWPSECREVARKIRRKGYHGLIYKSVRNRPRGVCVAVFLERAEKRVALAPVDEEDWNVFLLDVRTPKGGKK